MAQPYESGVRWSGLDSEPFDFDRQRAYWAAKDAERKETAHDRFLRAVFGVSQLPTFESNADTARSACLRGFMDEAAQPSIGELGVALAALADVPGQDARNARAALAEIMLEAHRKAVA